LVVVVEALVVVVVGALGEDTALANPTRELVKSKTV